ncbi:MAG: hypothetical protein K8M05_20690 [Deltaproteobacteria bacterium]|nr:hypothetical protein [Kofleriaceae bacterium]
MATSSRRRRKERKQRKKTSLARAGRPAPPLRLSVRMEALELATGHDGLLRGAPEPVVVIGVYAAGGDRTRLAGRSVYRFARPGAFPCKVAAREPASDACTLVAAPGDRLVILALAVEEDRGRGVQALFAELERGDGILVWSTDRAMPAPLHLHELEGALVDPDLGHRVELLLGEHDPARHLDGDDWVGAAVLHADLAVRPRRHRLHLRSADGRNDWTAQVEVSVRRA